MESIYEVWKTPKVLLRWPSLWNTQISFVLLWDSTSNNKENWTVHNLILILCVQLKFQISSSEIFHLKNITYVCQEQQKYKKISVTFKLVLDIMKHKKAAVMNSWIPDMILALDTLSSDLPILNSKSDHLHLKGNMEISTYETHHKCNSHILSVEYYNDGWCTFRCRNVKSQGNVQLKVKLPKLHLWKNYTTETAYKQQRENTTHLRSEQQ